LAAALKSARHEAAGLEAGRIRLVKICSYAYEEYLDQIRKFHGTLAPGLIIGGFMVDTAMKNLPPGELFDAMCETPVCLPDAVQMLTPCSIGNRWLKIFDYGKFAIALYEKYEGRGVRVYVDPAKLEKWPEIKGWFMKLVPKHQQDTGKLLEEIRQAGAAILSHHPVQIKQENLKKKKLGPSGLCPVCKEAYPLRDGASCRPCRGDTPYAG